MKCKDKMPSKHTKHHEQICSLFINQMKQNWNCSDSFSFSWHSLIFHHIPAENSAFFLSQSLSDFFLIFPIFPCISLYRFPSSYHTFSRLCSLYNTRWLMHSLPLSLSLFISFSLSPLSLYLYIYLSPSLSLSLSFLYLTLSLSVPPSLFLSLSLPLSLSLILSI